MENICHYLTFDVELFFGAVPGGYDNCIERPTEKILNVLNHTNSKGIFFIDASYLLFLNTNRGFKRDLNKFRRLIAKIERDHQIGLHIHPHWVDARGAIEFESYTNYCFTSLASPSDYFQSCIDVINDTVSQRVSCFRAGGYCSQPFTKIASVLARNGIFVDSSVVPGMKLTTTPFNFDYSNVTYKTAYNFSEVDLGLGSKAENVFTEYPVSTHSMSSIDRVKDKALRALASGKKYGDGEGLRIVKKTDWRGRIKPIKKIATFDDTSFSLLHPIISSQEYFCSVSHPKNFSKFSLRQLSKYLDRYSEATKIFK